MSVAQARRHRAAHQPVHVDVGQHRQRAVEQSHVDMLTATAALPRPQGGLNRVGGVEPGEQIGDRHPHLVGFAVGRTGDAHQPGHALHDVVVAGHLRVRSVLTEAGDRAVHQPRVEFGQAGVVQPVLGQPAHLVVFDQHVGVGGQPADDFLPLRLGDVHGQRFLAAVGAQKIGRGAVRQAGRRPLPGIVAAARALHLDHFRAQVGQQLAGPRPGQYPGQIQYLDAFQRARHLRLPIHRSIEKKRPGKPGLQGQTGITARPASRPRRLIRRTPEYRSGLGPESRHAHRACLRKC